MHGVIRMCIPVVTGEEAETPDRVWIDYAGFIHVVFQKCLASDHDQPAPNHYGNSLRQKIKVILGATGILLLILLIGTVFNAGFAVGISGIVDNMVASFLSIFIGKNDSELIGIGHRFLLWPWVYETVKDKIIFGFGVGAPVAVKTTLGYTKVSIEVAWLATLYYTGLIGLFGLITYQFGCMKHALRRIKKKLFGLHYKNINYYFLTATIAYFIVLFSCNFGEDMRFHYIFLALVMCCNRGHFGYDAFGLSRKED